VRDIDHRDLGDALADAVREPSGVRVLRLPSDRRRNVALHAEAAAIARETVEAAVPATPAR
jgi:hypothetical protein